MQSTTVLNIDDVIAEHNLDVIKVDSLHFEGVDGKVHAVKTRMHQKLSDFGDYLAGMRLKYPTLHVYLYEVKRYEANEEDREWYAVRYGLAVKE